MNLLSTPSRFWLIAGFIAVFVHILLLWKISPWLKQKVAPESTPITVDLLELPAPLPPVAAPVPDVLESKPVEKAQILKKKTKTIPPPPKEEQVLSLEELIQEQEAPLSMKNLKSATASESGRAGVKSKKIEDFPIIPDFKKAAPETELSALKLPAPQPESSFTPLEGNYFLEKQPQANTEVLNNPSFLSSNPVFLPKPATSSNKSSTDIPPPPGSGAATGTSGNGFFSLNNYNWGYESYMGRWAKHLRYAWNTNPPFDYMSGRMPQGGDVFVLVTLGKDGSLKSYEVTQVNGASLQMENSVVNAVLESSKMPPLPPDFTEENLVVHFRFIYPLLRRRLR